jgi:hypothetical protein
LSESKLNMPLRLFAVVLWTSFVPVAAIAEVDETVTIVASGRDPLPVIVSTSASERVRSAAETLASYLGKMSRAKFSIENSAGQRLLMTVPPALARNAKELLLPMEVVDHVENQ